MESYEPQKTDGENIPAERPTAETKKKDTKNLLKIEEILAQYSAITGKLIRIVSFFKHLLVGFI